MLSIREIRGFCGVQKVHRVYPSAKVIEHFFDRLTEYKTSKGAVQLPYSQPPTLTHWVVGYSERIILPLWCKYNPNDLRPQNALNAARE